MNTIPQLRAMTLGDLLDAAFHLYRAHFLSFVGIVALLQVPLAMVQFLAQVLIGNRALVEWMRLSARPPQLRPGQSVFDVLPIGNLLATTAAVAGINILLSLFVQSLIAGALAHAIARCYMGQPLTITSAYLLGARRYGSLILASLILTAAPLAALLLVGGSVAGGAAAFAGRARPGLLIGLAALLALGSLLVVVPLLIFFGIRFLLATQAIVLEERGPLAGLGRSWRLVGGSFWRVLGIVATISILIYILAGLPTTIVNVALSFAGGDPLDNLVRNQAITTLVSQIGTILAQPIALTIYTLLYYDLRIRKEGYDIEILARQAALS
jgi:hypothetical protein